MRGSAGSLGMTASGEHGPGPAASAGRNIPATVVFPAAKDMAALTQSR